VWGSAGVLPGRMREVGLFDCLRERRLLRCCDRHLPSQSLRGDCLSGGSGVRAIDRPVHERSVRASPLRHGSALRGEGRRQPRLCLPDRFRPHGRGQDRWRRRLRLLLRAHRRRDDDTPGWLGAGPHAGSCPALGTPTAALASPRRPAAGSDSSGWPLRSCRAGGRASRHATWESAPGRRIAWRTRGRWGSRGGHARRRRGSRA
jgi:hypothetical protein